MGRVFSALACLLAALGRLAPESGAANEATEAAPTAASVEAPSTLAGAGFLARLARGACTDAGPA